MRGWSGDWAREGRRKAGRGTRSAMRFLSDSAAPHVLKVGVDSFRSWLLGQDVALMRLSNSVFHS